MRIRIELTPNQANIILRALQNEANDDACERGEYSYGRCYADMSKKLAAATSQSREEK